MGYEIGPGAMNLPQDPSPEPEVKDAETGQ
jgi:hypothetical protein